MKSVIFTGGIGSGKSYFAERYSIFKDWPYYDFDKVWRNVLTGYNPISKKISDKYQIAISKEGIDRSVLSEIVFDSMDSMAEYMDLIKQDVSDVMMDMLAYGETSPCVFEIPLGYKWKPFDEISTYAFDFIGVFAERDRRIDRIIYRTKGERGDFLEAKRKAMLKILMQPAKEEYMHLCHACIWNEYNPDTCESIISSISERLGSIGG